MNSCLNCELTKMAAHIQQRNEKQMKIIYTQKVSKRGIMSPTYIIPCLPQIKSSKQNRNTGDIEISVTQLTLFFSDTKFELFKLKLLNIHSASYYKVID